MRPFSVAVGVVLVGWGGVVLAQEVGKPAMPPAGCAAVMTVALPGDVAAAKVLSAYPKCDSYGLYAKKDFAGARACAIRERAALLGKVAGGPTGPAPKVAFGEEYEPAAAGGLAVLTEMYANGTGVARNSELAARFFCEAVETGEVSHEPEETGNVAATFERLRGMRGGEFHFCVNAQPAEKTPWTRGCEEEAEEEHAAMHEAGIQAGIDGAQEDADNADKAVRPVVRKMTAAQRAAYARAEAADRQWIGAMVTGDTLFMGGYGSGGLYPEEEQAAFENLVVDWAGKAPAAPAPGALGAVDEELNAVYGKLIATLGKVTGAWDARGMTPEGLRGEERAWIRYRDASVALGKALHPEAPESAWLAAVTEARVLDLKQICDLYCAEWTRKAEEHEQWERDVISRANADVAEARGRVAQYFDPMTPGQAAAWDRVGVALDGFVAAHAASVPHPELTFKQNQRHGLYGEVYAIGYNRDRHFVMDKVKVEEGFAANEARLNAAYRADMASACPFEANFGDPPRLHRTREGLRGEERAWLKLREAWADFLETLFPDEPRAALENMFTGGRAFQLEMLTERCRIEEGVRAKVAQR